MTGLLNYEQTILTKAGNLKVSFFAGYICQFKISSWAEGLQFLTFENEKWIEEGIDPGILLANEKTLAISNVIEQFIQTIPNEIRESVCCFQYKQFSLLRLVAKCPKLRDVLLHSPTLCWLVVCSAEQQNWSVDNIVRILQLKRVHIVEKLFSNESMRLVKLINKLQLINYSEGEALLLIKLLKNVDIVNAFNHWKIVPIQALRIVNKSPFFINSKLINNELEITKSNQKNLMKFAAFSQTYDDLHRMHNALDKTFDPRVWLAIESSLQLTRLHDKWVARYNRSERGRLDAFARLQEIPLFLRQYATYINDNSSANVPFIEVDFPVCPIGDLRDFIQIKNSSELSEEGIYMSHCVGSYREKLVQKKSYIYKLLKPERATVELEIRGDKISVTQFKLANNLKPAHESYAYLTAIMNNYQSNN